MSFLNVKRTRSQLTLPDLDPDVLGRSPLKDAKLALRHASNYAHPYPPSKLHISTSMEAEVTDATDEENEILMTPDKNHNANMNKKRLYAGVGGAAGRGRRVTRSVSMKAKVKASMDDEEPGGDAAAGGALKSYSFTFRAPIPSGSRSGAGMHTAKSTTSTNTKMRQMSMKDFIAGSSTSFVSNSTSSKSTAGAGPHLTPAKRKLSPTSPSKSINKHKPAWNASAGSPSVQGKPWYGRTVRHAEPQRPPVKPTSTLSTLSIALEKLSLPRPVRPNTSLGFNSIGSDNSAPAAGPEKGSKDDGMVGLGLGGAKGLKRSATVGDKSFSSGGIGGGACENWHPTISPRANTAAAGSNGPGTSSPKGGNPSPQRPSSIFIPGHTRAKNAVTVDGTSRLFRGPGHGSSAQSIFGGRGNIMAVGGGGLGRKASKKTTLPSVMASPMKNSNGHADSPMNEDDVEGESEHAHVSTQNAADISVTMNSVDEEAIGAREEGKGKEKERSKDGWSQNASRRASMASHALTQSLSSLPRTPTKGSMGPPRTPGRAVSSSYPTVGSGSGGKWDDERRRGREELGAKAGSAKSAPSVLGRVRSGSDGHIGTSRSARIFAQEKKAELEASQNEKDDNEGSGCGVLSLLKECVIFVDVRTDGGDDAGGLFMDMLKGMGARILTRVGPSCTHIVYKNGLMSTLTRYRLLPDPKPLVVGVGWVVECVEQRTHVDEARFGANLDGMNVAGANKRRRSMLPKLISGEEYSEPNESQGESSRVDVSMETLEGDSSMRSLDEEDLPPLEKARRRRPLLIGQV